MPGEAYPNEFTRERLAAAQGYDRGGVDARDAQRKLDDLKARLRLLENAERQRAGEKYPTSPTVEQDRRAERERHYAVAGAVLGHVVVGFVSARLAARQLSRFTGALAVARGSGRGLTLTEARRLVVPALWLVRAFVFAVRGNRTGR